MAIRQQRRILRLIAGLLGLVVVGTLVLVVNSPPCRQWRTLAAIRKLHGPPSISADSRAVPRWIRRATPWEFTAAVYAVDCSLHRVRKLSLSGHPPLRPFSDADFQQLIPELRRLPDLERVTLCDSAITDAGIRDLSSVTRLRAVDLSGTAITDASVSVLAQLPNLEHLDIDGTKISSSGRKKLRRERPGLSLAGFDYSDAIPPRLP